MFFAKKTKLEASGQIIGFLSAYILFSSVLFFALQIIRKASSHYLFFNIITITFFVAVLGLIVRRFLK